MFGLISLSAILVLVPAAAAGPRAADRAVPASLRAASPTVLRQQNTSTVDLVQVQLVLPKKVRVGKTFSVLDEVENQGESFAANSVTGFYLSLDDQFDEKDLLVGARRVPQLASQQAHNTVTPVTIKAPVPAGDYYLIALADARHDLEERYRSNNTRAAKVTVEPAKEKE
ncbi:MAG TPA: CARDB domain-containing protein [Vicinamibacterales bacterium]|nr:hypothetical protein [Acidobacteriota bacterium]HOC18687.1 CARDB domain-containing protein [Vicinamibacterales bacterium]